MQAGAWSMERCIRTTTGTRPGLDLLPDSALARHRHVQSTRQGEIGMRITGIAGWLAGVTLLVSLSANAADTCQGIPWSFGMSQDQVRAVSACGPYRAFSNGDLETYQARFDGKQQNFQFFFEHSQLRRIGIYTYEGTDQHAAVLAFLALYQSGNRVFGSLETPDLTPPTLGEAASETAFVQDVNQRIEQVGKVQFSPQRQPADAFVFASLKHNEVQGKPYYVVTLYLDRPEQRATRQKP
jgi:hypothetical protein